LQLFDIYSKLFIIFIYLFNIIIIYYIIIYFQKIAAGQEAARTAGEIWISRSVFVLHPSVCTLLNQKQVKAWRIFYARDD
jgi:hypothetical protein